jgi:hypothetical protein
MQRVHQSQGICIQAFHIIHSRATIDIGSPAPYVIDPGLAILLAAGRHKAAQPLGVAVTASFCLQLNSSVAPPKMQVS